MSPLQKLMEGMAKFILPDSRSLGANGQVRLAAEADLAADPGGPYFDGVGDRRAGGYHKDGRAERGGGRRGRLARRLEGLKADALISARASAHGGDARIQPTPTCSQPLTQRNNCSQQSVRSTKPPLQAEGGTRWDQLGATNSCSPPGRRRRRRRASSSGPSRRRPSRRRAGAASTRPRGAARPTARLRSRGSASMASGGVLSPRTECRENATPRRRGGGAPQGGARTSKEQKDTVSEPGSAATTSTRRSERSAARLLRGRVAFASRRRYEEGRRRETARETKTGRPLAAPSPPAGSTPGPR